jgi:hypothetical protein
LTRHTPALFFASGATEKKLLKIPGADQNDIFMHGMRDYMDANEYMSKLI